MNSAGFAVDGRNTGTGVGSQGANTSPTTSYSGSYRNTLGQDALGTQAGRNAAASPQAEKAASNHSPSQHIGVESAAQSGLVDGQLAQPPTILIRGLPFNMSREALISMFLFSEDFVDAQFVPREHNEENSLLQAFARFRTLEGAQEVKKKLHGKQNATLNATMIIDVLHTGSGDSTGMKRRASDAQPNRQLSVSASSGSSTGNSHRQSSRYNTTFQSLDRISPPKTDPAIHLGQQFSPQSPVGASFAINRRMSGKAVINDDSADDETKELLKDPLAYARGNAGGSAFRQDGDMELPTSRMASLKLNTNSIGHIDGNTLVSSTGVPYSASRFGAPLQSPGSEMSPSALASGMPPMSPASSFQLSPQFQRHQYPPANPADQNPPCNTLYVGNLPVDTSEDELKAVFCKQRGYKRLCFRTKHNGPMCFVEFEDVSFATKALNELYGHPLHNSVKGGIRLSFSKNPLGVRTGQGNSLGAQSPLSSPTSAGGFGSVFGVPPGFGSANGLPPGLSVPPGLSPPISMGSMNHTSPSISSFYGPNSPPISGHPMHGAMRGQANPNAYFPSAPGGAY